jgi:peptide/nickel transport system permease protein
VTIRRTIFVIVLVCLIPLVAPSISPHDPTDQSEVTIPGSRLAGPSWKHPLGTDLFSRDALSRVLHGARISVVIAAMAITLSVTVGATVGLFAGLAGGAIDTLVMRILDVVLSIPRLFLLLLIFSLWRGAGAPAIIVVLGLTSWFETSRLVRAEVLSARSREYIAATRSLGYSGARVAFRHVLPNITAPLIVSATLGVGQLVLLEAGLSFLGIGVPQPQPSLGNMIADNRDFLFRAPLLTVAPGVVIIALVLAFSTLGEWLRNALNPGVR